MNVRKSIRECDVVQCILAIDQRQAGDERPKVQDQIHGHLSRNLAPPRPRVNYLLSSMQLRDRSTTRSATCNPFMHNPAFGLQWSATEVPSARFWPRCGRLPVPSIRLGSGIKEPSVHPPYNCRLCLNIPVRTEKSTVPGMCPLLHSHAPVSC